MLVGVGIDILAVGRMRRELARDGGSMLDSVFTPAEIEASEHTLQPEQHLAQCFCAKEALFKALGTGWARGVTWLDVELRRDAAGRCCELSLSGESRDEAERLGVRHIWIDTTCSDGVALATVLLEQDP